MELSFCSFLRKLWRKFDILKCFVDEKVKTLKWSGLLDWHSQLNHLMVLHKSTNEKGKEQNIMSSDLFIILSGTRVVSFHDSFLGSLNITWKRFRCLLSIVISGLNMTVRHGRLAYTFVNRSFVVCFCLCRSLIACFVLSLCFYLKFVLSLCVFTWNPYVFLLETRKQKYFMKLHNNRSSYSNFLVFVAGYINHLSRLWGNYEYCLEA